MGTRPAGSEGGPSEIPPLDRQRDNRLPARCSQDSPFSDQAPAWSWGPAPRGAESQDGAGLSGGVHTAGPCSQDTRCVRETVPGGGFGLS